MFEVLNSISESYPTTIQWLSSEIIINTLNDTYFSLIHLSIFLSFPDRRHHIAKIWLSPVFCTSPGLATVVAEGSILIEAVEGFFPNRFYVLIFGLEENVENGATKIRRYYESSLSEGLIIVKTLMKYHHISFHWPWFAEYTNEKCVCHCFFPL